MPSEPGPSGATCVLCDQEITGYRTELHDLVIDDRRTVRICDDCAGKVLKWQSDRLATLFPTKAAKQRRERGR